MVAELSRTPPWSTQALAQDNQNLTRHFDRLHDQIRSRDFIAADLRRAEDRLRHDHETQRAERDRETGQVIDRLNTLAREQQDHIRKQQEDHGRKVTELESILLVREAHIAAFEDQVAALEDQVMDITGSLGSRPQSAPGTPRVGRAKWQSEIQVAYERKARASASLSLNHQKGWLESS